jgi:hypothetical protein
MMGVTGWSVFQNGWLDAVKRPSGAKARIDFGALAPRTKIVPFQNPN